MAELKNLLPPAGPVDVVLDTDAYNEIDDQFAIAYLILKKEKIRLRELYAAPFHNTRSNGPKDGMEKSYDEILRLLKILGREDLVCRTYRGSESYLPDEKTPADSPAARALSKIAREYSPEKPLYVLAIGAITNVASAILLSPEIARNIVVVWLGGHGWEMPKTDEFNMRQDIAAARVVLQSGAAFVQLPCRGVVSHLTVTEPELRFWLSGKNALCDYLADAVIAEANSYAAGKPWSRVIWDISTVSWLLNEEGRFLSDRIVDAPLPAYDETYDFAASPGKICYVYAINRDAVFEDLFTALIQA